MQSRNLAAIVAAATETCTVDVPGCGRSIVGDERIHLAFVDDLGALRLRGEFIPQGGGSLDEQFRDCKLSILPDSLKAEKQLESGNWLWAIDQAVHHDQNFFRPGSSASFVLAMEVRMERDEVHVPKRSR